MTEQEAKKILLKVLYIYGVEDGSGYFLYRGYDKDIIVAESSCHPEHFLERSKSWREALSGWEYSIKADVEENCLYYLTEKEYELLGYKKSYIRKRKKGYTKNEDDKWEYDGDDARIWPVYKSDIDYFLKKHCKEEMEKFVEKWGELE